MLSRLRRTCVGLSSRHWVWSMRMSEVVWVKRAVFEANVGLGLHWTAKEEMVWLEIKEKGVFDVIPVGFGLSFQVHYLGFELLGGEQVIGIGHSSGGMEDIVCRAYDGDAAVKRHATIMREAWFFVNFYFI